MKRNKILFIFALVVMLPFSAFSADRVAPKKPKVQAVTVRFNGDFLKGSYLVIDTRSEQEKRKNIASGKLDGDIIVFLHGHSQRTSDCYNMTSLLALNCKSGIVVIPIVDTPYGKDKKLRGDAGKDVILMEIARYALHEMNIKVSGFKPICDKPVRINSKVSPVKYEGKLIPAKILVAGWSHGGILVRRFAHAYPDSVERMIQMCPAGFESYGKHGIWSTPNLLSSFAVEGLNCGLGMFTGDFVPLMQCTWGITKGQVADNCRTLPSCLWGNFHVGKSLRQAKDCYDCSITVRDDKFNVGQLKSIVTLFGESDTLFEIKNAAKMKGDLIEEEYNAKKKPVVWKVPANVEANFWKMHFPANVKNGTKMTLRAVKGPHAGPGTNATGFAKTALKYSGEMRNAPFIDEKQAKADSKAAYKANKKKKDKKKK